ncbi:MAG TPA: DHA2 family efflux MFS transporter permease subunit [Jatrophihabitantaceae bacterium]|jgi:EmrB/QacA subfamily drug resistance transporter
MANDLAAPQADAALERSAASADHIDPHHARRWWILGVLGLAQVMVVLDATVVNIALPTAQRDLGFSDSNRQWVITAYALAFGSLLLLGGRLADLLGHKRMFIIGLIGFGAASALGGAANGFTMLVIARAVQGGFGALLAPAGLALMARTFTEAGERAKAFGIYGAIAGAGGGLGLLLGGVLTEYASWRWTLFINLAFAGIALVGAMMFLQHQPSQQRPRLDLAGALTVSAGLFALVYGFSHADTDGWGNGVTVAFLTVAVVLLVAFFAIERRIAHPLMPLRVLLDRNRGAAFLSIFMVSIGMFAVFLFLTYYLQVTKDYSAVRTGVAYLPMIGALTVTAAVGSSVLGTRVSPGITVPIGLALGAIGMFMLTRLGVHSSYAADVLPPMLIMGVGMGIAFASAPNNSTLGVDPDDAGVAGALFNVTQQVGGSVGTALLNTLAASAATSYLHSHHGPGAEGLAAVHSYSVAYWWAGGIMAAAAVLCAIIFRNGVPQVDPNAQPVVAV